MRDGRRCPSCGAETPAHGRFCLHCGKGVPRELPVVELREIAALDRGGGIDGGKSEDRQEQILSEIAQIRQELHALRVDLEKQGMQEVVNSRVAELEVEQRLYELEQEVIGETEKATRKGWRPWRH